MSAELVLYEDVVGVLKMLSPCSNWASLAEESMARDRKLLGQFRRYRLCGIDLFSSREVIKFAVHNRDQDISEVLAEVLCEARLVLAEQDRARRIRNQLQIGASLCAGNNDSCNTATGGAV